MIWAADWSSSGCLLHPMIVTDERNESLMPEVNFDVGLNKKAEHS
jgi:hypothetical protein